jgi:hypothetical protein
LKAAVREESPGEYLVDAPGTPAMVASLTAWLAERELPLADLRITRLRLEDVFLQLTADSPVVGADALSRRGHRRRGRYR